MGHRERRKRSEFLTEEEIEALFLHEYEAEISKNCATEFDKRLKYVFEVPEILEKAWKMPWDDSITHWMELPDMSKIDGVVFGDKKYWEEGS